MTAAGHLSLTGYCFWGHGIYSRHRVIRGLLTLTLVRDCSRDGDDENGDGVGLGGGMRWRQV